MLPDVYVHYILPRIRGDSEVSQIGVDTASRSCVLEFLHVLITGSKVIFLFFDFHM